MKQILIFAILAVALSVPSVTRAQNSKADRIVGIYLTYDDETGKEKSGKHSQNQQWGICG